MYSTLDLLVCLGYFVAVVAVGFLSSRRQHASLSGYFQASNQLPWYAIGFSIVAAGISSEQFVGEMGYAYKLGLPVANWEWLVLPGLSALLWIFAPLYVRNRIATMPEYLERRFGPRARTLYAGLTIASYVLVNFALVFYTGGFALEKMWGINRVAAVWGLALVTGAYTVYGGLTAVAWTSSLQCVLLLGGGLYVFFAGLAAIHWDVTAMLGAGQQARLFTPADHEVPWTALVVLMLSTNVWYYATNQYINQRCLAARNEWHARMGVLFSAGLQLLIPLATCFPGMIYRVLNPALENPDAAYPMVVAAVVPAGLRGLVVAAILSAIMSTVSGLVNSTSTMVTLDLVQRWRPHWSEARLVRVGRWSGAVALLIGAGFAPVVMKWQNIFRYAQDIWAPMAAPVVVVFLAGALWAGATERGALACLWLSILSVPVVLAKAILADANLHFIPSNLKNLENPMVLGGAVALIAVVLIVTLSGEGGVEREPTRKGMAEPVPAAVGSGMDAATEQRAVSLPSGAGEGAGARAQGVGDSPPQTVSDRRTGGRFLGRRVLLAMILSGLILWLGAVSPSALALVLLGGSVGLVLPLMLARGTAQANLWDRSMLKCGSPGGWWASLWFWWFVLAAILVGIYVKFW